MRQTHFNGSMSTKSSGSLRIIPTRNMDREVWLNVNLVVLREMRLGEKDLGVESGDLL